MANLPGRGQVHRSTHTVTMNGRPLLTWLNSENVALKYSDGQRGAQCGGDADRMLQGRADVWRQLVGKAKKEDFFIYFHSCRADKEKLKSGNVGSCSLHPFPPHSTRQLSDVLDSLFPFNQFTWAAAAAFGAARSARHVRAIVHSNPLVSSHALVSSQHKFLIIETLKIQLQS